MQCSDIWKNTCCIFLGRIILLIFRPAFDTQLVWFGGWRLCRVWGDCVCDGARLVLQPGGAGQDSAHQMK